jgi:RHS repeat-associated protein
MVLSIVSASICPRTASSATTFQDQLVQPPSIGQPQRGSLAGTLSRLAFGPGDLAQGTFKLPLALSTPSDRGPLLIDVIPTYSAESGISEWGVGWQADLAIRRFRPLGELDFSTDQLTSPWGRLAATDDGAYIPAGLKSMVRVNASGGGFSAQGGDGTTYTFAAADAVTTARGTYMWMLSRVDNVFGDRTTLQWMRNASGRPFLSSVQWGGRGDGTQYKMSFDYETVTTPFVSFASGDKLLLDRRVSGVTVAVKQGDGSYLARWHYALSYVASPSGPAFYLQSVTKTYASGASDPAIAYDYDLGSELLAATKFSQVTALDSYLSAKGGLAIQPDHAVMTDLEQNGLTDFESAFDQTTLRQGSAGFVSEALPPASGVNVLCRPAPSTANKPRNLARMHGDAAELQVLFTKQNGVGGAAHIVVCDRLGVPIYDQNIAGSWELGANTRLGDVDADQRPDIVRVASGQVQVLRNTSASPQAIAFSPGPSSVLSPALTPIASWLFDVNGDGIADVMIRHSNGVMVWLGKGEAKFETAGTNYAFLTNGGATLSGISNYQFSHGDFNGDGLLDVILTQGSTVLLFTNRGGAFVQVPVSSLSGIPFSFNYPRVVDLTGSGNEEAVFLNLSGNHAMSIPLTSASTGLMRGADDGKGTQVSFGYARARPANGVARRHSTLTSLTVASSGYDTVSFHYDYSAPVVHTLGKFLIGFGSVDKFSPFLGEHTSFLNDDDIAALPSLSEQTDERTPGIIRFNRTSYEEALAHGVRFLRPTLTEGGSRNPDGSFVLSTTSEYSAYERDFCPTATSTSSPSGVLLHLSTLASIAAIPDDLHCTPSTQTISGIHSDPSLDFSYSVSLERNDLGQLELATQYDVHGNALVLQDVGYDANHRVKSVSVPGHGTSLADYDALGRFNSVTDAVGVVTRVDSRDALSEAVCSLQTLRPDAPATAFAQYDVKERLQAAWDDVSGASQTHPLAFYSYRDPTANAPGRIDTQTVADAVSGTSRSNVALVAADGEELVSGTWLGDHYALGTSTITSRNDLRKSSAFIGTISGDALAALQSSDLRTLGTPLANVTHAGFGQPIRTTVTHQASVSGTVTTELLLDANEFVTLTHQPGDFTAETVSDAAGKVLRKTDETGVSHLYTYDALGRLRRVEMPDGAERLDLDGFGRPARVTRDGIGSITYEYDPTSGLLATRQRLDRNGVLTHASTTSYDGLGRPIHVAEASPEKASDIFYDYDGNKGSGGGTPIPGQRGRLSHVKGDGWERQATYDALGRVTSAEMTLTGWRKLNTQKHYRADGTVASYTLSISNISGASKFSSTNETVFDGLGRLSAVKINGAPLYTVAYDDEGRLARADFNSGEAVQFDFDPTTHRPSGHRLQAPFSSGSVHWQRNERGLIASESYALGATSTENTYSYDARGTLTQATNGDDRLSYSYQASGLLATVSDGAGTRSVARPANRLVLDGGTYLWDSSGRLARKGDWTFDYGASGELIHASRVGRQLDFVYDESGNRLLKKIDGTPVRANVAGGVLTEDHFVQLISVGDLVVGVLDNNQFTSLLTDARGSPLADSDGTPNVPSPYGVRSSPLDMSETIDYARFGWDADLDMVRMGARDYDPKLGQFLTPDSLYLENLEKCQESPIQCSLYGYAAGNPVSFVDPTGTDAKNPTYYEIEMGKAYQRLAVEIMADLGVEPDNRYLIGFNYVTFGISMKGRSAEDAVDALTAAIKNTRHYENDIQDYLTDRRNQSAGFGDALTPDFLAGSPVSQAMGLHFGGAEMRDLVGVAQPDFDSDQYHIGYDKGVFVNTAVALVGLFSGIKNLWKNECFVAGTPVLMADGSLRPIEQVAAGDEVLALNPDRGVPFGSYRVERTLSSLAPGVIALELDLDGDAIADGDVVATEEHPFWVDGKGFVPLRELASGESLQSPDGRLVLAGASIHHDEETRVYSLQVADAHTFFVAGGDAIVLVHNRSTPNKMQQEVRKGKAPADVEAVHRQHTPVTKDHVHFCDGTACNYDGTPSHGGNGAPKPSEAARKWLESHGWVPPPR